MKCKGLFDSNSVVFVPVTDESVGDMMRDVKSYACNHGVTIKTEAGIFVNQNTMSVEKVIRCEVIGEIKPYTEVNGKKVKSINLEKLKKIKEAKEKAEVKRLRDLAIISKYDDGVSVKELSEFFEISKQSVYNIIKERIRWVF